MRQDLIHICDNLTLYDMVEMREYLSEKITSAKCGNKVKSPSRCSDLMEKISEIQGEKISYRSRIASQVWARSMVAYQMIKEGYSTLEVGEQMHKNHSTIIYLKKKMQDALYLPQAYRDIMKIWDNFQKQLLS